jgi:hypothetical protein
MLISLISPRRATARHSNSADYHDAAALAMNTADNSCELRITPARNAAPLPTLLSSTYHFLMPFWLSLSR